MNCAPYAALTTAEQADLLAHVIIAIQTDEKCFKLARAIYGIADVAGVYEKARPHVDRAALRDVDSAPIENGPDEAYRKADEAYRKLYEPALDPIDWNAPYKQ